MKSVLLGAKPLTIEDVRDVAISGKSVGLSKDAQQAIDRCHKFLLEQAASGETFYGINTGFGAMARIKIDTSQLSELQYNILRSHAVGTGNPIPDEVSRAMLLLRAASLAHGNSGVSRALVDQIIVLLNKGITPIIPEQGSVGASGDLAPLAHLALPLIGEGRVRMGGKEMDAAKALKDAGLKPIRLGPKEGLALINGTQFMTAFAALAVLDAEYLCDVADVIAAMSLEVCKGSIAAFDAKIHAIRPHPGQIKVAERMRAILGGGQKSSISRSHENCDRVQDSYSFRCVPQVHGASRDVLEFVRGIVEREINSVTDNPLIFPEKRQILSGGNFHGQYVSIAMDTLAIAMAELANISEQRFDKLMKPEFSGLPMFLAREGGLNSGFMIVHVAAASIVSENKTLCHPASVDSLPTNADKEDHVSMGAWAARKAAKVIENTRTVLAMELFAAAEGLEFLRPLASSPRVEKVHSQIRKTVQSVRKDRYLAPDIERMCNLLKSKQISAETSG